MYLFVIVKLDILKLRFILLKMDTKKKASKLPKTKNISDPMPLEQPLEKRVHLSLSDKGGSLKLSQDFNSVTGSKGYRSIIANYPIIEGTYYFEAKVEKSNIPPPFSNIDPQLRIGIATKTFDREISLGSDQNSYGYKSIDGCAIHQGIKTKYSEKYGEGDVIGCLVHMKPPKPKVRNQEFNKIAQPEVNEGSKLIFFKNGKCLGTAFQDLKEGFYFAAISLYMNAKVRMNFGPEFEKPPVLNELPEELHKYKPYSAIATEPTLYKDIEFY
jgi:hypothetical protein